jgi:hypothetical protein
MSDNKYPFEEGQMYYFLENDNVIVRNWDDDSRRAWDDYSDSDRKLHFTSYRELYVHLLNTHDWTFEYSDDHSIWTNGLRERRRLVKLGNAEYFTNIHSDVKTPKDKYYPRSIADDFREMYLREKDRRGV